MAFGFQGVNPSPKRHWGQRFWDIARAEGEERERLTNQRDAILQQARNLACETKTQQSTTRGVDEILGGIPDRGRSLLALKRCSRNWPRLRLRTRA